MKDRIPDLDQQYLDHWMRLFSREKVSAQFAEAFKTMHKRLAAYMAHDRPLIASMASQLAEQGARTAVARAREILKFVDEAPK
jgi:hypothetical protein